MTGGRSPRMPLQQKISESASRKLLVERLYPMLNRHEIAGADGEAINIRWENQMREAAAELDRLLGIERPPEADASVN